MNQQHSSEKAQNTEGKETVETTPSLDTSVETQPRVTCDATKLDSMNRASTVDLAVAVLSEAYGYAKFGVGAGNQGNPEKRKVEVTDTKRMSMKGVRRLWVGATSVFTNAREASNDVARDGRSLAISDVKVHDLARKTITQIQRQLDGKKVSTKLSDQIDSLTDSVNEALSRSSLSVGEQQAILATVRTVLNADGKAQNSKEYRKALEFAYGSTSNTEHRRAYGEAVDRWRAAVGSFVTSGVARTAAAVSAPATGFIGAVGLSSLLETGAQNWFCRRKFETSLGRKVEDLEKSSSRELESFFDVDKSIRGILAPVTRHDQAMEKLADARAQGDQQAVETERQQLLRNGYRFLLNAQQFEGMVIQKEMTISVASAERYHRLQTAKAKVEADMADLFAPQVNSSQELISRLGEQLLEQDPLRDPQRAEFIKGIRSAERSMLRTFQNSSMQEIKKAHSITSWKGARNLACRFTLNTVGNSLAVVAAGVKASMQAIKGVELIAVGENAQGQVEQLVGEHIQAKVAETFARRTGLAQSFFGRDPFGIGAQLSDKAATFISDAAVLMNKIVTDIGWQNPFTFDKATPNFDAQWQVGSATAEAQGVHFSVDEALASKSLDAAEVKGIGFDSFAARLAELKASGYEAARFYDFGEGGKLQGALNALQSMLWMGSASVSAATVAPSVNVERSAGSPGPLPKLATPRDQVAAAGGLPSMEKPVIVRLPGSIVLDKEVEPLPMKPEEHVGGFVVSIPELDDATQYQNVSAEIGRHMHVVNQREHDNLTFGSIDPLLAKQIAAKYVSRLNEEKSGSPEEKTPEVSEASEPQSDTVQKPKEGRYPRSTVDPQHPLRRDTEAVRYLSRQTLGDAVAVRRVVDNMQPEGKGYELRYVNFVKIDRKDDSVENNLEKMQSQMSLDGFLPYETDGEYGVALGLTAEQWSTFESSSYNEKNGILRRLCRGVVEVQTSNPEAPAFSLVNCEESFETFAAEQSELKADTASNFAFEAFKVMDYDEIDIEDLD